MSGGEIASQTHCHASINHLKVTVNDMVALQVDQRVAELDEEQQHLSFIRALALLNQRRKVAAEGPLVVRQYQVPAYRM